MSTKAYQVGLSWEQIAEAGSSADFILENKSEVDYALLRFAATKPTGNEAAHYLPPGGSFIRAGVMGKVYVKANSLSLGNTAVEVVVSGS